MLDLADRVLERFRPEVLLTYGGHPAGLELMQRARLRGIEVAFHSTTLARAIAGPSPIPPP